MLLIGLSGGIGAGKSTIATKFAELGAIIIDADEVAKYVVSPGQPAIAQIAAHFGTQVLTSTGELDRSKLAKIVFGDRNQLKALQDITHPYIKAEVQSRIARAGDDATVVYDVPLLIEAGVDLGFDHIVMAMASPDVRMHRLINQRGMTAHDALARITAQASDDQRIAIADTVIKTDGTLDETYRQVTDLWQQLHSA